MCRNHSHLIASYVGEDTGGEVPALMFALANPAITIQAPVKNGSALVLNTSGLLYVPAYMLAGSLVSASLATEAPPMSLAFIPDDGLIGIRETMWSLTRFSRILRVPSSALVPSQENDDMPF